MSDLSVERLVGRRLLEAAWISTAIVVVMLLAGQAVQVHRVAPLDLQALLALIPPGLVVLTEPVLPLICLLAAGLAFAGLRRDGALSALAALGVSSNRLLALPALMGAALGLTAAACAASAGPQAVRTIRRIASEVAVRGWLPAQGATTIPGGSVTITETKAGRRLHLRVDGARGAVLAELSGPALVDGPHGPRLEAGPTWIWTPSLRARVGGATFVLDASWIEARLRWLGPPNDLPSAQLDPHDRHHAFIGWRRIAMPLLAPIWAALGALLGGGLRGSRALVAGAGVVASGYWLLRTGELTARAGLLSPAIAALAPVAWVTALTGWAALRAARPPRRPGSGRAAPRSAPAPRG